MSSSGLTPAYVIFGRSMGEPASLDNPAVLAEHGAMADQFSRAKLPLRANPAE